MKLQLGVLYFHLRSYEMARNYFDAVINAPDTPSDIRTEVQTYIAAVDKAVAINQFSVYGQFGLAYQTNANAGPNSPNVLALGQNALLSPQFQKTPDWNAFGLVAVHDFYDFNDQRGDGWESDLVAYYSQQFKVTRLDLGLAELRTGPRLGIGDYGGITVHPYAIGNELTLGGVNYLNTLGGGVSMNWPVNETLTITPGVEFRNRYFYNSDELSHRRRPKRRTMDRLCLRLGADFRSLGPVVAGPRLLHQLERELWAVCVSRFLDRRRIALFFRGPRVRAYGLAVDVHARGWLFLHPLRGAGPVRLALRHPHGSTMAGVGNPGYELLPQHRLHAAGPISAHLFDRSELQPSGFHRRRGAHVPLLTFRTFVMRRRRSLPLLFAALPLGACLALSAGASANTVGTAGAVNTTSSGTVPGAPTRVIEIGTQVVENEKIQTTATGSVQVLFIDKTTLNVGPNSTLVIDRFVYNPATTKGELALSLGKGVLRVVGGVATHSEGATIRTPVAAIGLRGGIAMISHSSANGTHAILGFGHMSVTSLCGGSDCHPTTIDVSRPGYGVTVTGFNRPPSAPGRISSQELALASSRLTSQKGQSGGTTQQPTDNQARTYNVGTPTSPGAPITQTASQGRANALTVVNATQQTVTTAAQTKTSTGTATRVAIQNFIQALTQVVPPPITPPPIVPPPIVPPPIIPPPIIPPVTPAPTATYAMVTQGPFSTSPGSTASPFPYLTGAFAGTGNFTVSPILGYQRGGLNPDGTPDTTSRQFQAGLSVTGQGAAQNATLFVMTSAISNAPNIGFTQAGGFTGVTMRNGAGWYGLATGAVSSATPNSAPNSVTTRNGVPIAGFALNNTTTNLNTGTVANTQSYNYVQSGPANYKFNPVTAGTPTTLANNHPTLSLNGYVGGVMVTATGGASPPFTNYTKPYVITNLTGKPGDVGIFLPGDSSEMLAIFNVGSVAAPANGMTSSSYVFGSLNGNGLTGLNSARGTYVNPTNFGARDAAVFNNGANTPVSLRNGQSLSSIGGYSNQLMVTAESVGANTSAFLTSISSTNVQPCACKSTQWGFWSAINGANTNGQLTFEDQGVLLLWVAGVPATAGSLPVTGTATYTGHAIASIAAPNSITSYLAAGAFSAIANFATRTGAVSITGLDGTNYTGTAMQKMASPTTFTGSLIGNNNGRTGTLAGSFFQGGPTNSTPAYGEIGGSLILNGTGGYLGSGIFAARKP